MRFEDKATHGPLGGANGALKLSKNANYQPTVIQTKTKHRWKKVSFEAIRIETISTHPRLPDLDHQGQRDRLKDWWGWSSGPRATGEEANRGLKEGIITEAKGISAMSPYGWHRILFLPVRLGNDEVFQVEEKL
ncbi:hypothetical protein AVEN_185500-1 [Araneus ventricosus]|uniref:Uncharacterized protein n=1 Tax=Araneus ventricosus TaxID=182803 RepID=A0A4Y2GBF2_ARAVE|nr:hypothetical protein AVEN_185500-1 [Araneus ventricosus]